ncbi:putative exonuclease GOR [Homalodisca vitripennis]|uniref:putative exonuclease GOR n=1 Tax=Homalodisca vitripennis TaxID=197043 RepID=UPI001EEB1228|nr:putative exonuclease GOR [Homalodisca vitripennis]
MNGPLEGFVRTLPRQNSTPEDRPDVYALDCEMGFTVRGLELLKVTVITQDGSVKYESLVRPKAEIVDYNTRFSGVKEEEYCGNLRTLREVQSDMTEFIKEDTILIGHGLEKDLRAFRMVYSTYVDTGVVFPHRSKTILRVTRAPRTPWPVWIG